MQDLNPHAIAFHLKDLERSATSTRSRPVTRHVKTFVPVQLLTILTVAGIAVGYLAA